MEFCKKFCVNYHSHLVETDVWGLVGASVEVCDGLETVIESLVGAGVEASAVATVGAVNEVLIRFVSKPLFKW